MASMRKINQIKKTLRNHPVSSLGYKDLQLYFEYRLNNLLRDKQILVKREWEYLLGETGPGTLRIDKQLTEKLSNKEDHLVYEIFKNSPEIKRGLREKINLQKEIINSIKSRQFKNKISKLLGNYLKEIKIIKEEPLILKGNLNDFPIFILFQNDGWVFPSQEVVDFIGMSYKNKSFPVIIAKKIHGILFPFFKMISVIGVNTYELLVSEKIYKVLENFNKLTLLEKPIKYNEKIGNIDELSKEILDNYYEGSQIKTLFEITLPKVLPEYYDKFLQNKLDFNCNFRKLVSQLKGTRAKRGINKWLDDRDILF